MSGFYCNNLGQVNKDLSVKSISGNTAAFDKLKANYMRVGKICADVIDGANECCQETTAIVTSSQVRVLNPPLPPSGNFMVPSLQLFPNLAQPFQFVPFDLPLFDNDNLWDTSLSAFNIQESGRYMLTYTLTMAIIDQIPPLPADIKAIVSLISIHNSADVPLNTYAINVGVPHLLLEGYTLHNSAIIDLDQGQLVHLVIMPILETSPPIGNPNVALYGQVSISNGTNTYLNRASSFSINKLSKI